MTKVFALVISFIFILFLTNPVFAGSGFVSFENVDPGRNILPPGGQYVVKVTVRSNFLYHIMGIGKYYNPYCNGCSIKIKLENPQDTDSITQSDTKTDENGQITAKIISNIFGRRSIYAEVVVQGGVKIISDKYVLNYYEKDKMEVIADPPSPYSIAPATPDVKDSIEVPINPAPDTTRVPAAPGSLPGVPSVPGCDSCTTKDPVTASATSSALGRINRLPKPAVASPQAPNPSITPYPSQMQKALVKESTHSSQQEAGISTKKATREAVNTILQWFRSHFPFFQLSK